MHKKYFLNPLLLGFVFFLMPVFSFCNASRCHCICADGYDAGDDFQDYLSCEGWCSEENHSGKIWQFTHCKKVGKE